MARQSTWLQRVVLVSLGAGCTGGGDTCATDPLQCIQLVPDSVQLDPRDYRTRPAVGYFGVKNESPVEVYVTPRGFIGDGANLLTVRDDEDMVVPSGETLLLDVSYQPLTEQWQHGAYTAELSLDIGWFDTDVRGPAAVRRREAGESFTSAQWTAEIRFEWDCDVDNDGFLADVCGESDCNDQNPDIYPDADELCDRADNNCDGEIDNDPVNGTSYYFDGDNDGWGDSEQVVVACSAPTNRYVTQSGDCDDDEAFSTPGGYEFCNDGIDGNCDGEIDEDCPEVEPPDTGSADTDTSDSDDTSDTSDTADTDDAGPDTSDTSDTDTDVGDTFGLDTSPPDTFDTF